MTVDIVLRMGPRVDGVRTPVGGRFIVHYNPMLDRSGAYRLDVSNDIDKAIGFSTVTEAAKYIRRPCPNKRYDSPGHINRPITCYHIELVQRVRP